MLTYVYSSQHSKVHKLLDEEDICQPMYFPLGTRLGQRPRSKYGGEEVEAKGTIGDYVCRSVGVGSSTPTKER